MAPPQQRGSSYRPTYDEERRPPKASSDVETPMYEFQANEYTAGPRQSNARRPPSDFKFRYAKPRISERPLLTAKHDTSEEMTFGTTDSQHKFRQIDDLSDTDETEMDCSDSESGEQPSKRMRLESNENLTNDGPRWSNPDPYTSLPPVDDSSRKRKDVVKLIRKARVTNSESQVADTIIANDEDFISFDFDGGSNDFEFGPQEFNTRASPPRDAPKGPRATALADGDPQFEPSSSSLGKRKRNEREEDARVITRRNRQYYSDAMLLQEWRPVHDMNSTPWLPQDKGRAFEAPGIALHREIIDFYEWVKPQDFEQAVRLDVIHRLQKAFERIEPGGQLKPFGSFAAGLYLPTGDMDLVYIRRSFRGRSILANGMIAKPSQKLLREFCGFIRNHGLAREGTLVPILGAKVPIIKFVEKVSGLKVDLSFDNDTGITANQTFQNWKRQYPAMPVIVSIIKQFLMIRGLNDVATGGLGGFSIICLVTSLIQHLPITGRPPNLGMVLIEFFNLYGNLFNRHDVAIRLEPPSYLEKRTYAPFMFTKDKPGRLAIVDPNRPDNNISGGTDAIEVIFKSFAKAHETLLQALGEMAKSPDKHFSLLKDLIGGNLAAYETQRKSLHELYQSEIQKGSHPPPPPPLTWQIPDPPPPPASSTNQVVQNQTRLSEKAKDSGSASTKSSMFTSINATDFDSRNTSIRA